MEASRVTSAADKAAAFAVRTAVFVDEQQVPRDAERDEHDQSGAVHYLARTADGTACGAARWRPTAQGVKLERFAVLAPYRNQEVGAALLQSVLSDVQVAHPGARVYLHAQLPAVRFYQRHGFVQEGPQFTECDIEHFKMRWQPPQ